MELEVTVGENLDADAAILEAHRFVAALGIEGTALIKGAYVDLFAANSVTQAR